MDAERPVCSDLFVRLRWWTLSLALSTACTFDRSVLDAHRPDASAGDAFASDVPSDAAGFDGSEVDAAIVDVAFSDVESPDVESPDVSVPDSFDATFDGGAGEDAAPDAEAPDAGAPADPFELGPVPVVGFGEEIVSRGDRDTPVAVELGERPEPSPLFVLLPGFQLTNAHYAELARHLASHGFVVARAQPPAGLLSVNNVEMVRDVGAVLDRLLSGPYASRIDPTRVGVGGHSLGGKVATMVANRDARVKLLLGLDPVNGAVPVLGYTAEVPDVVPSELEGLAIPVGFIGELADSTGTLGQACAPLDQNYATFFDAATSAPWAGEWTINGADHTDFIDDRGACGGVCRLCQEGPRADGEIRRLVRGLSAAFLLRHFFGRSDLEGMLSGPDPVVAVRRRF